MDTRRLRRSATDRRRARSPGGSSRCSRRRSCRSSGDCAGNGCTRSQRNAPLKTSAVKLTFSHSDWRASSASAIATSRALVSIPPPPSVSTARISSCRRAMGIGLMHSNVAATATSCAAGQHRRVSELAAEASPREAVLESTASRCVRGQRQKSRVVAPARARPLRDDASPATAPSRGRTRRNPGSARRPAGPDRRRSRRRRHPPRAHASARNDGRTRAATAPAPGGLDRSWVRSSTCALQSWYK